MNRLTLVDPFSNNFIKCSGLGCGDSVLCPYYCITCAKYLCYNCCIMCLNQRHDLRTTRAFNCIRCHNNRTHNKHSEKFGVCSWCWKRNKK
jgi:hypothetical protein